MSSLPTTVKVAKLPFYLPNGLPVWANDIGLDLSVKPDRMFIELTANFDAMNAKLIARSGLYSDLVLPELPAGKKVLTMTLVARNSLCTQYHQLFLAANDPVAAFIAGPMPDGAKYSPLLSLENYDRREWQTAEAAGDDELEDLLAMDLDNI